LNGRPEGARCALDDDNTFVLLDDVLAPGADLIPESACRLWLLRGQAPWASRLLQQVAHGLTPEAVLSRDDLDTGAAVEEVERMLYSEPQP